MKKGAFNKKASKANLKKLDQEEVGRLLLRSAQDNNKGMVNAVMKELERRKIEESKKLKKMSDKALRKVYMDALTINRNRSLVQLVLDETARRDRERQKNKRKPRV